MSTKIKPVVLLLIPNFLFGCSAFDAGRPMPTKKLEPVLPQGFQDYKLVNTVRNPGGPPVSELTGHYKTDRPGVDGEIRIVIEDWGDMKNSPRLPVDENGESYEYRDFKCYYGFPGAGNTYQVMIPIGMRILIRV